MKGEKTLKILEAIGEGMVEVGDAIDIMLTGGYGISVGEAEYKLNQRRKKRMDEKAVRQQRQRFYCMLNKLKKDELLVTEKHNRKSLVHLTAQGKKLLTKLQKQKSAHSLLPKQSAYQREDNNKFVIVVFDIPESERKKRDWLRGVLGHIGLRLIQKSVWMGKIKIPEELLNDLKTLNLTSYVEIFEISKTGTLRSVV